MKLLGKVSGKYFIACSGGPDSMAALHYIHTRRTAEVIGVINVIHQDETNFCYEAAGLVSAYAEGLGIKVHIFNSESTFTSNKEQQWREERYKYFRHIQKKYWYLGKSIPIITAHHLDDALETYLMSFLKAGPNHTKVIPYERREPLILRPFLLTRKEQLRAYCAKWDVPFLDDPFNELGTCTRSIIRHEVLPKALAVNPGLYKQVERIYRNTSLF